MKATCNAKDLRRAVDMVSQVVRKKSNILALLDIMVSAMQEEGGYLKLRATDLELSILTRVAAEVEQGDELLVPAAALKSILKQLRRQDAPVCLETAVGNAVIESARPLVITHYGSRWELAALPAEDFPGLPEENVVARFSIPQPALRELIQRVLFAVNPRDPRKIITGAHFVLRGNTLSLAGTDGKQLSVVEQPLDQVFFQGQYAKTQEISCIIPHSSLAKLAANLGKAGNVAILFHERKQEIPAHENLWGLYSNIFMEFDFDDARLFTMTLAGEYPKWQAVILTPENIKHSIILHKAELAEHVRAAGAVVQNLRWSQDVLLSFAGGQLTISSRNVENRASYSRTMPVPMTICDEPITLAFNSHYLLNALGMVKKDFVRMRMVDNKGPCIFDTTVQSDGDFCLVMPIGCEEESEEPGDASGDEQDGEVPVESEEKPVAGN